MQSLSRRLVLGALAIAVVLALAALAMERPGEDYALRGASVMSTDVTVLAPAPVIAEASGAVFAAFREVEATANEWKPDSALGKVNRAAGKEAAPVPPDLLGLVQRSVELAELTGGAFDPTWAALWGLWDFRAEPFVVPDPAEVARRAALVDWRTLQVDPAAGTVYLPTTGMQIGLGGIAKGHALALSAAALREQGVTSALLSAGGQVLALGTHGDRPWRVGIRDPRGPATDYFARLEVADTSVSTSGDYERFAVHEGTRYHHILDPRTGQPARGLRSATVITPDPVLADALSTALMVLGPEAALALATRLPDVEAVLVDAAATVHTTPGLAGRLHVDRAPRR